MTALVAPPVWAGDPGQMLRGLATGRWILVRHAWIAGDRDAWKAGMVDAAAGVGLAVDFLEIPNRDLVLGINLRCQPSVEQVVESVAAMENLPRSVAAS